MILCGGSDLEDKNLQNMILNICTERQVKFFFEIYLPVREHTWFDWVGRICAARCAARLGIYVRSCGFGYRLAIYLWPCRLADRLVGPYTYTEPPHTHTCRSLHIYRASEPRPACFQLVLIDFETASEHDTAGRIKLDINYACICMICTYIYVCIFIHTCWQTYVLRPHGYVYINLNTCCNLNAWITLNDDL